MLSYAVISDLIIGTARETVTYGCLVITMLLLIAAPFLGGEIRLRQRGRVRRLFTTNTDDIERFREFFSDQRAIRPKVESELTKLMDGGDAPQPRATAELEGIFRGVRSRAAGEEVFAGRV